MKHLKVQLRTWIFFGGLWKQVLSSSSVIVVKRKRQKGVII
ncbi:MAG TPA: hypothetical protein VKA91_04680 [Nitrososphaeraceae archaeon]|nr:hypothetical protein [Nitrososphaeraceae archaeon]